MRKFFLNLCLNEPCLASISCYIEPTLTTQYQQKPAAEISQNFFFLKTFFEFPFRNEKYVVNILSIGSVNILVILNLNVILIFMLIKRKTFFAFEFSLAQN